MTVQHNGTTDPNEGRLNAKEIYAPLVELVIHGQDNKLNLFSSFLFFQSILLLAWATVWQTELAGRNTILLVFSIFGVISSGPWAVTGSDYADASRQFCDVAEELEKRHFPNDIPRFLSARGETVRAKAFGGRHLIGFVA